MAAKTLRPKTRRPNRKKTENAAAAGAAIARESAGKAGGAAEETTPLERIAPGFDRWHINAEAFNKLFEDREKYRDVIWIVLYRMSLRVAAGIAADDNVLADAAQDATLLAIEKMMDLPRLRNPFNYCYGMLMREIRRAVGLDRKRRRRMWTLSSNWRENTDGKNGPEAPQNAVKYKIA
jgi:hypothetical protein